VLKIIINFQQTALKVNSPGLLLETEPLVFSFTFSFRPLDQIANTHTGPSFPFGQPLSVLWVKN
jgi:hypothetical protein